MAGCTIHPIPTFRRNHALSGILFRTTSTGDCTIGGYAWYIQDEGKNILVDAAASINYLRNVKKYTCEEIQTLEQGLKKIGVGCEDIDIVIFTHLHQDHIGQASTLPKARLIAQRDEIRFALNPHPFYKDSYPEELMEGLNFEDIDGDTQITENVAVILTPGHTVGGQSVSVKTEKGVAIISGLCSIQENYDPSMVGSSLEVIPPTPHVDPIKAYDSMIKIKNLADYIIPNHDPKYIGIASIP